MSDKWTTGNYVGAASGGIFVLCAGSLLGRLIKIIIALSFMIFVWGLACPQTQQKWLDDFAANNEMKANRSEIRRETAVWMKSVDLDEAVADLKNNAKDKPHLEWTQEDDARINNLLKDCKQNDEDACTLLRISSEVYAPPDLPGWYVSPFEK
jgi:hypothetical protein